LTYIFSYLYFEIYLWRYTLQRLYKPTKQIIKFLFLGDSYTCCEQEKNDQHKWPVQLAKNFLPQGDSKLVFHQKDDWVADFNLQPNQDKSLIAECKIIAKTAMRSDELYQRILLEKNFIILSK
jgi:hypothetical protein